MKAYLQSFFYPFILEIQGENHHQQQQTAKRCYVLAVVLTKQQHRRIWNLTEACVVAVIDFQHLLSIVSRFPKVSSVRLLFFIPLPNSSQTEVDNAK